MGLIGAIERFEPERGIKFETFAMTRIRGAIIDELRSLDWVPRSVRSRAREIEAAQAKLEHELQRAPTEAELAAKLGMSEEELQTSLLEIANSSVYALDELWTISDSSGDSGLAARHDLRPARRRPAGVARQQRDQGPPHRGDRRRCPSASSSSSPSTTTRTSPCARSARCSASPSRASPSCTPRR